MYIGNQLATQLQHQIWRSFGGSGSLVVLRNSVTNFLNHYQDGQWVKNQLTMSPKPSYHRG